MTIIESNGNTTLSFEDNKFSVTYKNKTVDLWWYVIGRDVVGWETETDVAELEVIGRNGRILVQLQQHEQYQILQDHSTIKSVEPNHTPLEAVLLDFLQSDSSSSAASTGSILRTIKCVEQARLQLTAQGRSKTRELKR